MKRLFVVLVGTIALTLGVYAAASAHARLDHCTPAVSSTVAAVPSQIVCVYSEEIDTKLSTMSVWDASGKQVDKQDAHVDLNDADHKTLIASVDPALAQTGLLTVKWHSVTPGDGGISDGSWQFVVGAASATPYPPTEVAQGGTPAAATPLAGATTTEVIAPATPQSSTPSPVSTPAGTPTPVAATGATGTGIWVLGAGVVVILAVIGLVLYARSS